MDKDSKHTAESKRKMIETRRKNGTLGVVSTKTRKKNSNNSARIWAGKKLSEYPELAHKLSNGITYCEDYHLGVIHNLKQLIIGGGKNF